MPCPKFNPMLPRPQGIYVEPTNICTLKCAGCARTDFIGQWPQHWRNHSIDVDALMHFLDIDLLDLRVRLSGNYGDPIYHPEFIPLATQLKQRGARLEITTNGSYRTTSWWQELAKVLDHRDTITFSIDGVPENFTEYRENADWTSIKQGIEVCVASTVQTVWKLIPFEFNQHCIEQARAVSQQLGFDAFVIETSKRFDDSATQEIKPMIELVNQEYESRVEWKKNLHGPVDPKCNNQQEHFITADGYYTPCCFVADHRWLYKTQFGRGRDHYNIYKHTLSSILDQPRVIEFYQSISDQPVCQFSCPKTQTVV
jgi:MoaA/NifB/PqqE/SkfB family radical SAM enzyme